MGDFLSSGKPNVISFVERYVRATQVKRGVSSEHQDMFLFLRVIVVIARRAARRRLLDTYAQVPAA